MSHVNDKIAPLFVGKVSGADEMISSSTDSLLAVVYAALLLCVQWLDLADQKAADKVMLELDGTDNKCEFIFTCIFKYPVHC